MGIFNYKLNYVILQTINIVLCLLSYHFVREHFLEDGGTMLEGFMFLLPVGLAGVYVFYTNRIFYVIAKLADE